MNKPQPHILYFPLHVFMLVMFFIVNGYRQNMEVLWFSRLLPLTGILLLVSAVLLLLAKKGQGTWHKAGLWVFLLMLVVLFYGVAEGAAQRAGIPVLRNWIYLSAIAVIGLPAFWIFLRRTKRSLRKITLFLNVLLVIYLAVEVTGIAMRWNKPLQSMPAVNIPPPANQHRPDIYFIILDEYMGGDELKNFYGYDNSFIERSLQQEGFHIVQHALCNYVNTTSSVGSMLNMQYLDSRDLDASLGFELTKRKLEYIRSNAVCKYLESAGYEISNQSIFHLG
ncbi:MAG TPA: hypothetical protein VD996_13285, partial [Chitinophagaceae bacterium]|nr:hypothetical protein [Chitinophagaceae bacterium]